MALIRLFVKTRDGAWVPSLVWPRSGQTREGAPAPSLLCPGPRTSAAQACGRGRLRGRVTFVEAKTTADASMFPDIYDPLLLIKNYMKFRNKSLCFNKVINTYQSDTSCLSAQESKRFYLDTLPHQSIYILM